MSLASADVPAMHPLADAAGDGWVATETRADVIALTTGMSDFLHRVSVAGARAIVVSGAHARMTQPLFEALAETGGHWVIRTGPDAFHDARSGAELATPAHALVPVPAAERAIAPEFLRTAVSTRMRIVVSLATRHRVSRSVRLGGAAEALATSLTGGQPVAWGATEPATAPWDRDELTELSRRRMPRMSRWVAVGEAAAPLVATLGVARTSEGLEETTRLSVERGAPGDPRIATLAEDARVALASAAAHGMPLMGFAFAYVGAPDLAQRPIAEPPPQPLALLVGPPGVRLIGLEARRWADEFGAVVLGSPRLPSVLAPLGSADGGGWERLGEIMRRLDGPKVAAALRLAPRLATELAENEPRAGRAAGRQEG